MKTLYWNNLCQLMKNLYYYTRYKNQAYAIDRIINVTIAVMSSASVATWAIWNEYSFVWAILIALSSLLGIIKSYFPYSKRISSLNYFLPELKKIIDDVQFYYNKNLFYLNEYDNDDNAEIYKMKDKISVALNSAKEQYSALENKYIDCAIFPVNLKIDGIAEKDAKTELDSKYKNYIKDVDDK